MFLVTIKVTDLWKVIYSYSTESTKDGLLLLLVFHTTYVKWPTKRVEQRVSYKEAGFRGSSERNNLVWRKMLEETLRETRPGGWGEE